MPAPRAGMALIAAVALGTTLALQSGIETVVATNGANNILRPFGNVNRQRDPLPTLLLLRGGIQPAQSERTATPPTISRAGLKFKPKRKLSKRKKGPAKFGIRDILTLALCLAAAAALQLGSEPLMAMVPQKHQSNAWIVFGGVFASGVYALVRLTNERAISIDRALARLLFDVEEPRSLASAALVFAVGTVASMQAGPMGAS